MAQVEGSAPPVLAGIANTEAWCRGCDAARTFTQRSVDGRDVEASARTASAARALRDERAWTCEACGAVRFRLADEERLGLPGGGHGPFGG